MDWKAQLLEHIPFVIGATNGAGINGTRIIEAALIAGVTALATSAMTADKVSARLEERVAAITHRIQQCENRIDLVANDAGVIRERLAVCESLHYRKFGK